MTLLAYNDLVILVNKGVMTGVTAERINATSIDITLGDTILTEKHGSRGTVNNVNLKKREKLQMSERKLVGDNDIYYLLPGEFILAQSAETFNLPDYISAEYKLKSSMARVGLEHLNAGWCDAGWNGSVLTLELKNMTRNHVIELQKGVGIGQMVFFKHPVVPRDKSYAVRGRYNNDKQVSGVKL